MTRPPVDTPRANKFRRDIEGLRGLAVAAVVASHFTNGLPGGFIGVDVFFVISGFLITGLLLKGYELSRKDPARDGYGHISLSAFYVRRARRILPAAVVCLTVTVALSRHLLNPAAAHNVTVDGIWSLFFSENFRLISTTTNYFQQGFTPSPLQHYWSLSVEEQFYLVWPALIVFSIRRHEQRIFGRQLRWLERVTLAASTITVISFGYGIWASTVTPEAAYFSSAARAFELGAGALAACWLLGRPRGLSDHAHISGTIGLLLLVASVLLIKPGDPFPGYRAALPVVGAMLILLAGVEGKGVVGQLLSLPPLRFLGRISYSVYLWHFPAAVLIKDRDPQQPYPVLRTLILLLGVLSVATASYYFIERPFLRHSPVERRGLSLGKTLRTPGGAYTGAVACAVLLGAVVTLGPTFVGAIRPTAAASSVVAVDPLQVAPSPTATALPGPKLLAKREQSWMLQVAAATRITAVPANMTPSLQTLATSKGFQPSLCRPQVCTFGRGPLTALVVGNSFAQMVGPMVTGALDPREWTVTVRWRSGCQVAELATCPDIFAVNPKKPVDLLVISDAYYLHPGFTLADAQAGIARAVPQLAKGAKKIIYVGQPYGLNSALIDCVDAKLRITAACAPTPEQIQGDQDINHHKKVAVEASGGLFVDLASWLCNRSCPPVVGSVPIYVDAQHVTEQVASEDLAPLFRLVLLRAGYLRN